MILFEDNNTEKLRKILMDLVVCDGCGVVFKKETSNGYEHRPKEHHCSYCKNLNNGVAPNNKHIIKDINICDCGFLTDSFKCKFDELKKDIKDDISDEIENKIKEEIANELDKIIKGYSDEEIKAIKDDLIKLKKKINGGN